MDCDKNIQKLEEKIEELEEKIENLQAKIFWLTISKLPNPRYPYYELLLQSNISDSEKQIMEHALVILSWRLEGEEIPEEFKKPFPGIPYELLYSENVPTFEEAKTILSNILGINNTERIILLLKALYREGRFQDICRHLLEQIGEDTFDLCIPF